MFIATMKCWREGKSIDGIPVMRKYLLRLGLRRQNAGWLWLYCKVRET